MAKQGVGTSAVDNRSRILLRIRRIFVTIVCVVSCVLALYPFVMLIINATRAHSDILSGNLSLIPGKSLLSNLNNVLQDDTIPIVQSLINSFVVAACSCLLSVYFSALTAYGIFAYNFKFKKLAFSFILLIMMVPTQVSALGFVSMMDDWGMVNSLIPLIVPTIAAPAVFFFIKQYMDASLPMEIIEAGRIDGGHEFYIFNAVVLPILKPAMAVQIIFSFVTSWNNYFMPALLLSEDKVKTLPLIIANLRSQSFNNFDLGKVYIMLAIAIVPLIVVYLCLSKFIIRGIALGSVKG